jgi:hypothetical protein
MQQGSLLPTTSAAFASLLHAERAKESTLSVAMVAQTARSESGVPVYDFEYELESTRGRKRILSTGEAAVQWQGMSIVGGKAPGCVLLVLVTTHEPGP